MRNAIRLLTLTLIIFTCVTLSAQENGEEETAEETLPPAPVSLIEPVFPETNAGLVHFEAEEAVSTNFAKTPTLDYGASGFRTLQLNRYTELFGNAPFYAEYVFFVEEPGEYELYYGGTPPGPGDEVFPSYVSPFSYSLNEAEKIEVHREEVNVVERYAPNYYWVKFGTARFDPGVHRMRIEVNAKRKYDGKFFFYLDSFAFINAKDFDRAAGIPKVFPRNLDNRSIDTPMKTFNDYRYLLSVEPDNVENYIEFSLIYALTGDYLNALRNVNKAMLLDPANPEAKLLAAKYRLWKGEADEALKMYRLLLQMHPDLRDAWAEAGKVAAWIGKYDDSINYYTQALQYFPDDLNLAVNRAITFLWASKENRAEEIFRVVETAAVEDVDNALELGEILVANGYPDRAIRLYLRAIKRHPAYVELYLRLVQAYAEAGQAERSTAVYDQISERFVPSNRLTTLLDSFAVKESMKERVIRGFTDALAENPDNPALREQLVQAYFWNGLRKQAIDEYHNIIVNYGYLTFSGLDRRSADLFELMDTLQVFRQRYAELPPEIRARRLELDSALKAYGDAQKEFDRFDERVKRARDSGNPLPEPEGTHPQVILHDAQSALADTAAFASEYLRWGRAFIQRSEELLDKRNLIAQEEQASRDSFIRLTADTGWRWNREQTVQELAKVSAAGFILADYVLGRIHSVEGRYTSARPLLDAVAATGDAPAGYASLQNSLWSGAPAATVDLPGSSGYAPYLEELSSLAQELGLSPSPVAAVYTESTLTEVQELQSRLTRFGNDLALHVEAIDDALRVLRGIARNRLERTMYEHQQETYLLRFELADYYLFEGDYAETTEQSRSNYAAAADQLRLVLDIDPLNTSAVYNIGILYDRLGRWGRAMESYADVYQADPRFENVAAYYNQLARRHADTANFSIRLNADSARVGQEAVLELANELNSVIGLRTEVSAKTVRMYQQFEGGAEPWVYQLNGINLSVPLTVPGTGLSLTPAAGIKLRSALLSDGAKDLRDALDPAYFISKYDIEPEIGGTLYFNTDYLAVAGGYRYGRYEESFRPGVRRLISHSTLASVRLDFGIFNSELLQYSSASVGGNLNLLFDSSGQTNNLYGINERLDFVFHLADSPWTNLTVSQLIDFQSSRDPGADYYYAPDNVLQITGALGIATWLDLAESMTFGVICNVSPGIRLEGSPEEAPAGQTGNAPFLRQTQLGADLRLELTVGEVTYFAAAGLSGSAAGLPGLDYWSTSLNLGVHTRLPRLLAQ